MWGLNTDVLKKRDEFVAELRENLETLREAADRRSESWQDSTRGSEVYGWIDGLETLLEEVETLEEQPEE